ncbi:MAG: DUF2157 domain-containing protein [Gammaproteobacteria bacterium]
MSVPGKTAAQHRADRIKAFNTELAQLARDGVVTLSAEQSRAVDEYHAALLARYSVAYDIDKTQQEKQLSWGMRIASFLGALALAASVFFLFYQFWGRFSTPTQVVILIAAALLSFVATALIAIKDRSGYFAKLGALVCFACFVLNISMLGQIFNITPSDKALLLWAALSFLLAYAYDIRLLQAAGIVCIAAFIGSRVGTWSGMYWIYFGERPENFFPAAALLFVIPHVIDHRRYTGFATVYHVFALLVLFIPMLILANYGRASYLNLDHDLIEGGYQVAGFVVSAAFTALGLRRGWTEVVNTGTVFFVIFLYTKFFDWWWEIMPKYLFFLIIALSAILFLLIFKRLRAYGRHTTREAAP